MLATAATDEAALATAAQTGGMATLLDELADLGVLRQCSAPGSVLVTPGLEDALAARALHLREAVTAAGGDWDEDDEDDV